MDTDGNKQITFEEFLSLLKQEKDSLESQMAERFGMKIYKSADLPKRKYTIMQVQRIVSQH